MKYKDNTHTIIILTTIIAFSMSVAFGQSITFTRSGQTFPGAETYQVALGDLDNDGDLDAVCANMGFNNSRIWWNDGHGQFTSGQALTRQGHGVALNDLDNDGDLDAFIVCATYGANNIWYYKPSKIYFNDGTGQLKDSGQSLGDSLLSANHINLMDIDTDGDQDAQILYYDDKTQSTYYKFFLNNGSGIFTESILTFPPNYNLSWGDLDADSDMDIFIKMHLQGYRVMLNEGNLTFSTVWELADTYATREAESIVLEDFDNDDDLDAFIINRITGQSLPAKVLFNDGSGQFIDSGQNLGGFNGWYWLTAGDLDKDSDKDIFISAFQQPNQVWLNDGSGNFYDRGLRLGGNANHCGTDLGDLDGDNDLDVFVANYGSGSNEVWLNEPVNQIAYAITPPDGNSEIFLIYTDGTGKVQLTDQPGRPYGPAFSPDTTRIVFYNHLSDQTWSLYMMNADGTNIQRLTYGTDTLDWSPDWSQDGSKLVFARSFSSPIWRSEIWVINPDGSNSYRVGDVDGQGPDWSPDGSKIVYFNYVEGGGDIWTMNAEGTNPIKLTTNPSEDWWPKYSPDGSKIAFQSRRDGNHEIYVMNSDGSNQVRLTNNSTDDEDPNWSPDGLKIAFISLRDGHYEVYTMNIDGTNQQRITYTSGHAIDPDWKPAYISPNIQELVAFNSDKSGNDEIYTIDITGNNLKQVTNNTYTDYWPSWSNDGKRICHTSIVNGNTDIYMINKEGTDLQRLTYHEAIDREPAVSPDGTRIAFESGRDGNPEIYVMHTDGSGTIRLTNNTAVDIFTHWSPNCQKMVFCSNRDGNFEIYSMDSDGSNQTRLTQNNSNDWIPKWSPDGEKILFVSERDGNQEIYVMNPDGINQKRITDHPSMDIEPDWSCDGSKIVFVSDRNGNHDIYVAELSEDYNLISCIQITNDPSSERHPVWQPRSDSISVEDSISINIGSGWNMISIPVDSVYIKNDLFPYSISSAYFYDPDSAGYVIKDTLETGKGYWLKFQSSGITKLYGDSVYVDSFDVKPGWNMIGSILKPVPVMTIGSNPPGLITSNYFTYLSGYVTSDTIIPGAGYWVKVSQGGKLILSSEEELPLSNRIIITFVNETPPLPPDMTSSVDEKQIPTKYRLYQNYPNPFNPSTNIRFDIPTQTHVRLEVYNVLGSLVRTLLDEVKNTGSYSITWDGKNNNGHQLPTGLYYYQLKSRNLCQTQKALLLK